MTSESIKKIDESFFVEQSAAMNSIEVSVTINHQYCANCGVHFGLDAYHESKLREDGRRFFCPNGHSLVFSSENARLKKQLEEAQRERTAAKCEAMAERHDREVAQKKLENAQKRAKSGMCPFCTRSFTNLQRHCATKHPHLPKLFVESKTKSA